MALNLSGERVAPPGGLHDDPSGGLVFDRITKSFGGTQALRGVSLRVGRGEIFRIADRVAVLRDGQSVGLREVADTTPEELVTLIVGRKAREINRPAIRPGPEVLRVAGLQTPLVGPASFRIAQGEVLGLAGLRGAGHEDIGRALFGTIRHQGSVLLEGKTPDLRTPQTAMQSGAGFVARDRVHESIAPGLSIRENASINPSAMARGLLNFLVPSVEADRARQIGRTVGLTPNDPTLTIEALSGGNQQKVVVGCWLGAKRHLLICEDPTAGVDVGAKAEIYHLLFQALASGMGVLVVFTDFEEIANICHRAIVVSRGLPVAELSGA